MTLIKQEDFIQSIADGFQFISFYHPVDFITAMGEAYEREFGRYLVRLFIERQPEGVTQFLDSDAVFGVQRSLIRSFAPDVFGELATTFDVVLDRA